MSIPNKEKSRVCENCFFYEKRKKKRSNEQPDEFFHDPDQSEQDHGQKEIGNERILTHDGERTKGQNAGFGLGFERCIMYLTGMGNIRDVIPFPRTVNNCEL